MPIPNDTIYTPRVRVVRFKEEVVKDGIYYVVSNNNTIEQCEAFEDYLNSTTDTSLKFNITPLTKAEVKTLGLDRQGLNPVTAGANGNIVITSQWAVFDMTNCPFTTSPRMHFVSMSNRALNYSRIAFLLEALPYVVELHKYLAQDNNVFKAATTRYRDSFIATHIETLRPHYKGRVAFRSNTLDFVDPQMYQIFVDLYDVPKVTMLLARLMAFTEYGEM